MPIPFAALAAQAARAVATKTAQTSITSSVAGISGEGSVAMAGRAAGKAVSQGLAQSLPIPGAPVPPPLAPVGAPVPFTGNPARLAGRAAGQPVVDQAAARGVSARPGGSVLQDTPTGASARDITRMLKNIPSDPAMAAARPQGPTTQPFAGQTTKAAARVAGEKPVTAQVVPEPPATPKGPIERVAQRFQQFRQDRTDQAARRKKLETPVTQETRDLTFGQRLERLKQGGNLLSKEQVAQNLLKENPTQRDIVTSSEDQEQRERDRQLEHAAGAAGDLKKSLLSLAVPVVGVSFAFIGATKAVEKFSTSVLERSRELARFSGSTATAFARLEFQSIQLQRQRGRATAGSTSNLAGQVGSFREEIAPLNEMTANMLNRVATIATGVGRLVLFFAESLPAVQALIAIDKKLQQWEDKEQIKEQVPFAEFLERVSRGAGTTRRPQAP